MKKALVVILTTVTLVSGIGFGMTHRSNRAEDERMAEAERMAEEVREFAKKYEFVGWRENTSSDSEYTITIEMLQD